MASLASGLVRLVDQLKTFKPKALLASGWQAIRPDARTVRGAAYGALLLAALLYLVWALRLTRGPLLVHLPLLLLYLVLGGLLVFLAQGITELLALYHRLEKRVRFLLLGALFLLILVFAFQFNPPGVVYLILALLLTGLLLGGGLAALRQPGWRALSIPHRVTTLLALLLGAAALLGGLYAGFVYPGPPAADIPNAALLATGPAPARLALPDPSLPGPYPVKTLTYGGGADRYRPEYAAQADLTTQPVDGSKLLSGSWSGPTGQLRQLIWDITPQRLPLNGRVWYPESADPQESFPLVLVVHGNHGGLDFSDPGYAYLGELLASRGYILVSVDMNFINGLSTDFTAGISGENDARGWLLLEHLRLWQGWNRTSDNPFYTRVDMDNIAVMGHSRGGEAAAIAAAFNHLPYLPDDYGQQLGYNFNIRAVVAIAPIDGQYNPAWRSTPLENVNYFVLQGSHDSDLTSFSGIKQYERVRFDPEVLPDGFKTALYIYRANHGQFNTVWGDDDVGQVKSFFLNRAALLSGEEQRQIARVYISAFLDVTLRGQRGYLPLFQDPRAAGEGWLPDTIYINRFDLAGDQIVADFEEDINLKTTSLSGGVLNGLSFSGWREQRLHSKWGSADNSVVYLAWNESNSPIYEVELPAQGLQITPGASLIFNLADALQDPPPGPDASPAQPGATRQPLNLTIQLEDFREQKAHIELSHYRPVQPQLEVQLLKARLFERYGPSEPVLQSYVLPLADFVAENPSFDPTRLRVIRFMFNRSPRGSVTLDAIGIRPR